MHPLAIVQRTGTGPVLDTPGTVVIHARSAADRLSHCPAVGNEHKKRDLANCDTCPIKGSEGCPFHADDSNKLSVKNRQRSATEQGANKKR